MAGVTLTRNDAERERLLRVLSAATFIIFFQAYMVAPVIPALANAFGVSVEIAGLIVPAYLIPYGVATLLYGLLADRLGVHRLMLASLAVFAALTLLTATAHSIDQLAMWRVVTGLGASGVVPLALTLVGRLYTYEHPAHRRIATQPIGVVHVLVARQPPEYRLPQQSDQEVASVLAGACLGQSLAAACGQGKNLVQLAIGQQSAIGGDDRTAKSKHQSAVEIEPQRLALRFTRRVRHGRPIRPSITC